jgi:hypothetical protein
MSLDAFTKHVGKAAPVGSTARALLDVSPSLSHEASSLDSIVVAGPKEPSVVEVNNFMQGFVRDVESTLQ